MNVFKARNKAKKVLRELDMNSIPVNVAEIAQAHDIPIIEDELNDISGIFEPKGSAGIIYVNASHSDNRKRFSIAHELGHYFLSHCDGIHIDKIHRDDNSSSGMFPNEIEANNFAAELLMPRTHVEVEVEKLLNQGTVNKEEIIAALSGAFQVSRDAISNRFNSLGYTFYPDPSASNFA